MAIGTWLKKKFGKMFKPKEKILMADKMTVVLNSGGKKKCIKH